MSMSDERTGHNPEQGHSGRREDSRSSHLTQDNTDAQQQGPLPGLAGFGQMHQRYAPVTQGPEPEAPAEQPAEPEIPQEIPADAYRGGAYPQEDHSGHPGDPDAQLFSDVFATSDRTSGQPFAGEDQPLADYVEQPLADIGAGGQEPPYEHGSLQGYYEAQGADPHYGSQAPAGQDLYAGGDAPFPYESGPPQGDDPNSALQPFEAHYDDHPEIALGGFDEPAGGTGDADFFQEPGHADAEFLGPDPEAGAAAPKERKGRRVLMAASGLIGVLALGGALAFAYKIGGDSSIASAGKPPLIQADNSPVKVAPDEPGGKEFPHKNKKIYDRLQGKDDAGGTEKIVPREEEVAASATGSGGQIASSGGEQSSRQAGAASPETTGATGQADASPRKVKTLMVRPDGSIVAAEQPAQPSQSTQQSGTTSTAGLRDSGADNGAGVAVTMPQSGQAAGTGAGENNTNTDGSNAKVVKAPETPSPAQQEEQQVASAAQTQQAEPQAGAAKPEPESAPLPQQKPAAPQTQEASASASASATPGASGSEYVVQVASRKSQTDALAAFADIQQKYPQLLSGYRPLIQRADLGEKGIWYRLNVGPVENKRVASTLCQKLKSAGMSSCLVRGQ